MWVYRRKGKRMKKGKYIEFLGHKLEIVKMKKENFWGVTRYTLDCRPECCTTPFGIRIECSDSDFKLIRKREKK